MSETNLIRVLLLLFPLAIITFLLLRYELSSRILTAGFLGFIWQFQWRMIVNILLSSHDLIKFSASEATLYNTPIDIILGQSLLLGFLTGLASKKISIWKIMFIILIISPIITLSLNPVITLQMEWHYYEFILFIFCIIPSLLLAKLTARNQHLILRSTLQSLCWLILLTWLLPSIIFNYTTDSWKAFLQRPVLTNSLLIIPTLIPILMIGNALYEFAIRGEGTGFPYDPPKQLVTTGIYAHLSNPMQVGICLLMAYWGFILQSSYVALTAAAAIMLFIVFKDICNGSCKIGKSDPNWKIYQQQVPRWIPRLKPWRNSQNENTDQ